MEGFGHHNHLQTSFSFHELRRRENKDICLVGLKFKWTSNEHHSWQSR